MGQQVNVYRKLKFFPGAVIEGWGPQGEGRTYYVNNITGSSTADGLSWNSAMDQVDTAIAASETFRALKASTNRAIRNTILIQGTSTAYEAVETDACNYIDFIGLGADPRGNGIGVAQISGLGAADGFSLTATSRGCNFYNIRFDGSGAYCAFDCTNLLRATFENCSFMGDAITNSALTSAFRCTGDMGGCVIHHCHIGTDWAFPTTGITLGTQFDISEISECFIRATTNGIYAAGPVLDHQGLIKNNVIIAATYGIRIVSGGAGYDEMIIANNHIISADAISRPGGTAYFSGQDASPNNWVIESGNGSLEHEMTP